MHHVTRAAATTTAALALVTGTGAASFAKPSSHADASSPAAVWKAERAEVKAAKAELREARKAKKRGAKVA